MHCIQQCLRQFCCNLSVIALTLAGALYTNNALAAIGDHGSLSIQTVYDSAQSHDSFIDLGVSLGERSTLFAGIGNTTVPESFAGAGNALDLDYWNIGLRHAFTQRFELDLEYSESGQDRDISTRDLAIGLNWLTDNWQLTLRPQFRELDLLVVATNRIVTISSNGYEIGMVYTGMQRWEWGMSYEAHSYDRNPRLLGVPLVILRLSSKALTVAGGVIDQAASIDITRLYTAADITARYGQSRSAVDGSDADHFSVATNFYQLDPYWFGIEVGGIDADNDDANYYGSITLGYAW